MTVLLLHAFPLDERMWEPQRGVLGGHDVEAPRLYGRGPTMTAWADSVAEETDGELMYPAAEKHPTSEEFTRSMMSNPDEAAARGLWSDPRFLERVAELNARARHTQFADFHGHGWVFRAVFKKDRKGNLLDRRGVVIPDVTTDKLTASQSISRT